MKKKTYEELVKESPVTYEMYANMEDDGNRYEISDGVLELLSPTPSTIHQMIRTDQAPLDFILSDTEVRQPDLLMIHHSRKSIIGKWGIFGAPNLVVEITSEHTLKRDKVIKRNVYANYGGAILTGRRPLRVSRSLRRRQYDPLSERALRLVQHERYPAQPADPSGDVEVGDFEI